MRNFACSLIASLLCALLLMVGGCTEEPTSPGAYNLSGESVESQEGILVLAQEDAPIHEGPPGTVTEVGKRFTISLESNPTTGYCWEAHFDRDYLELINNSFVIDSNLVGAPGVETFELKGIKPGETELRMIYKRSWEDQIAEERIILVQIAGAP